MSIRLVVLKLARLGKETHLAEHVPRARPRADGRTVRRLHRAEPARRRCSRVAHQVQVQVQVARGAYATAAAAGVRRGARETRRLRRVQAARAAS